MGKLEMSILFKRKNNNRFLLGIITFIILIYIILVNTTKVQADMVPVTDFNGVSMVDGAGDVTSGPAIAAKKIIALTYNGSNILSDTTIQTSGSATQAAVSFNGFVRQGDVVRVKNSGYYKGKPVVLAFTVDRLTRIQPSNENGVYIYATENPITVNNAELTMNFWLETETGTKITDDDYATLMPINQYFNPYSTTGLDGFIQTKYSQADTFKNVLVSSSSTLDSTFANNNTSNNVTYQFDYSNNPAGRIWDLTLGFIYPTSDANFTTYSALYKGTYPTGSIYTASFNPITLVLNPKAKFLIPLINEVPQVIDTKNDTSFQVNVDIRQALQLQGNDDFYNDQLDITATLPSFVKTKGNSDAIKIVDKDGNDITSQLTVASIIDGQVNISISKSILQKLESNLLTITGTFDLDKVSADLLATYDKNSGYLNIPVKATNNENGADSTSGTAKVKMPAPTAKAVETEVIVGTTTDALTASQLVTDLQSTLPNDTVTVEGFKESKTFSTLGSDSVIVKIKSTLTGVESEITVPITVVEQKQAQLSWSDKSKAKTETIDRSNVSDAVEETFYWQTPNTGSSYKVLVTKGTTIIASTQALSTTTANSWIGQNIDIPVSSLDYGANELTFSIYNSNNTTTLLDQIKLTLTMTGSGSLKIVSIPDELSWTNRTSGQSQGLLTRDSGNTMTVSVEDTRNIAEASKQWSLRAKATVTNAVPFDLVWKSDTTAEVKPLSSEVQVLTKSTGVKNGNMYTKTWDETTGILLSSPSYMKVGDYSNNVVVSWYLYDTEIP